MDEAMEVELKLTVAPDAVGPLLAADWLRAATPAAIPLAATYFDTPAQDLRAAGFTLRIRREGDRVVQTTKASGEAAGLFARPEWSCEIDGDAPRFDVAAGPLGETLSDAVRAALVPTFTTAVQRIAARLPHDGTLIELAIDRGSVSAGADRVDLCEVELELIEGDPAALFALARRIDAIAPARIGVLTKAERGQRLAAGKTDAVARAEPVTLDPDLPTGTAFARIAHACIRQFRINEDAMARADDPAVLHQARVGLRRLRSALSVFKPLFVDDPQADRHRGELRWLQQVLGEARDIDVLIAGGGIDDAARLALARAEAYEAVDRALASDRARAILLDFAEWLAIGAWRQGGEAARPIGETAVAILDKHRKRLKKRGRHLAGLDDETRHRVRIEAKKLRYATEFFAALYPSGKPARRHAKFAKRLEALQDRLGALNDLATAPVLLQRLGLPHPPHADQDRGAMIRAAADMFEDLVETRRFWR